MKTSSTPTPEPDPDRYPKLARALIDRRFLDTLRELIRCGLASDVQELASFYDACVRLAKPRDEEYRLRGEPRALYEDQEQPDLAALMALLTMQRSSEAYDRQTAAVEAWLKPLVDQLGVEQAAQRYELVQDAGINQRGQYEQRWFLRMREDAPPLRPDPLPEEGAHSLVEAVKKASGVPRGYFENQPPVSAKGDIGGMSGSDDTEDGDGA